MGQCSAHPDPASSPWNLKEPLLYSKWFLRVWIRPELRKARMKCSGLQTLVTVCKKREKVSPCALELFAGSCKLSKCLKSHGFAAFGIDHQKCKNRVGPCVVMDLTKKSSRKFILTMLSTGKVEAVPMAPPCGTSSRARERPIPRRLRRLGVPEPKQLRSSQYPEGFPWLKGRDYLRVRLANDCYETVSQVFQECHRRGIPCFIENPGNSRMWEVPCIAKLFKLRRSHVHKVPCVHARW